MSIWEILVKYQAGFLQGLVVTLKLCAVIWTLGIIGGGVIGWAGARWKYAIGVPSRVVSFVLSGTPVLVLLFWLHYPVQAMLNVVIDPFFTAAAALSIINTVGVADLVRGTINDFPAQYLVAAQVCGLSTKETVFKIQLPIMLRQMIPGLLMTQISMLQATLFASLISVEEIFRVAQRINATVYRPIQIYSALAIFFLMVCLPLNGLALWLRHRFTRDVSER